MKKVCLYFQVHQPFHTSNYSVFHIGKGKEYFDSERNMKLSSAIADRSYLPANKLMLDLIDKHRGKFQVSYAISGVAMEQFALYSPEVIDTFKSLADTGCVEFLSQPYHHSLSFYYSKKEFMEQVRMHDDMTMDLFGIRPTVFKNSGLVFNNELAAYAEAMGYLGIITNGSQESLGWRSPNYIYQPASTEKIKLLMRNSQLSEDIEHRFNDRTWSEYPLTAQKMTKWIDSDHGHVVNLFMSYDVLGERHKKGSGIFTFMKELSSEVLRNNSWATPGEIARTIEPAGELDIHSPVSENSLEGMRAILGNNLQHSAINRIYLMEDEIKATNDAALIDRWRKLQSIDHLHAMSTGITPNLSHHGSPYDSFITYMNILNDLQVKMKERNAPIIN